MLFNLLFLFIAHTPANLNYIACAAPATEKIKRIAHASLKQLETAEGKNTIFIYNFDKNNFPSPFFFFERMTN